MAAAPEFLISGYYAAHRHFHDPKRLHNTANNHFADVQELLDFSKEDEAITDAFFAGNSNHTCNSSASGGQPHFAGAAHNSFADAQFSHDFCVPYDDLAELEWLSNFVEDSFSPLQLQFQPLIPPAKPPPSAFTTHVVSFPVPGKARSKRSRAAPCDWSSRLLVVSSTKKNHRPAVSPSKKRDGGDAPGRKCLHCASEKTPQWRTGPMGPKTLCNACGVRYKSGRLVAEYRPAASPTFVSTKHSNSHRKVLDLRRQKEMQRQKLKRFGSQISIFGLSSGTQDCLINTSVSSSSSSDYLCSSWS